MRTLMAVAIVLGAALAIPFGSAQSAATVAGKWHFLLQTEGGDRVIEPVFQQDGEHVTGKWNTDGDVKGTFSEGKLNLEFPITSDEAGPGTLKLKGQLVDDTLTGDWSFQDYSGSFKATRVKEDSSPAKP